MPAAIEIDHLSKQFRLYNEKVSSLKERAIHGGKLTYEPFWALRDVSADINEGETYGILGRNGSGKSTLLKCVAGILKPTSGEVRIRGSLAAMLELGAGFQQELSGRDNIYLNGSLLGLSRAEIARRFDDIVAFAELEQFIDNQVKYYSSGMYVRLGFAVAVNVEPDILLVDEVLAVGDAAFQRKCLDHVRRFQREGRTIVVVSHATDVIRQNCERCMVLSHGNVIAIDEAGEAIRVFLADLLGVGKPEGPGEEGGGNVIAIGTVRTEHTGSGSRPHLYPGESLTVIAEVDSLAEVRDAAATVAIHDDSGELVFASDPDDPATFIELPQGGGVLHFDFPEVPLLDGTYSVSVGVRSLSDTAVYDWKDQEAQFEVANPGRTTGRVRMPVGVSFRVRSTGTTGEVPVVGPTGGPSSEPPLSQAAS
ncbi:ABC transporter ATP-binding protein [Ferrimicrobium sp.]|uniref:ABC transporter ATP-binding protein n=1 Tax=Ferrimicrobium sp. TaxID=2926050 RepID=UPI00230BBD3B|nr:ABC transporter ATP-binding protein [Ferrimicrobium sp.]MDA8058130.1 ABC transporter ATP-binding protein [Actinomycetota bacterium]MDA8294427.1 ABC transporter ATP-binding protein [Actinomycetota bacterium]